MNIATILIFLILMSGLGIWLLKLFKLNIDNTIERYVMALGIGLGAFPLLFVLLNTLKVPLNIYIFLAIAIIPVIYFTVKNKAFSIPKIKITKDNIYFAIVLLIFLIHLYVYISGAFNYPYLEDGDSWVHADVASYISEEQTYSIPAENSEILHYTEPYPPVYSGMMGLLNQLDNDIHSILKVMNSVLASLSILFIFFFVRRMSNSAEIALFSSFLLAVIPSFLSHFIFAATYATMLFFPALYLFTKLREDKSWLWLTALVFSGVFIVQPIASAMFLVLLVIYNLTELFMNKKLNTFRLKSVIFGLALAQIYWIPTFIKFGIENVANKLGFRMFLGGAGDSSGGVIYKITDYIIAPITSKIDQPTGWGLVLAVLFALSILFYFMSKKESAFRKEVWVPTFIIYSAILIILTEGNAMPYKFVPHRLWAFLAIGVVILSAYGAYYLLQQFNQNKQAKYVLFIALTIGLLVTSAYPKYTVETAIWQPGAFWTSSDEIEGYLWLRDSLPWGSRVMVACDVSDERAVGMNMKGLSWDIDILNFKKALSSKTSDEIYTFAKDKNYEYVIIDGACVVKNILTEEKINSILTELQESRKISIEHSTAGMILTKLN